MFDEIFNDIRRSINSMNALEVKGQQNMSLLLGAIYTLDGVQKKLKELEQSLKVEVIPDEDNKAE